MAGLRSERAAWRGLVDLAATMEPVSAGIHAVLLSCDPGKPRAQRLVGGLACRRRLVGP